MDVAARADREAARAEEARAGEGKVEGMGASREG